MCVNRSVAKTAAASVDETTAPSRMASSQERSNSACEARHECGHEYADGAEQRSRHRNLAQPAPRRLEPALVQDQTEPDGADLTRKLRVVELDPAQAV